MHWRLFARIPYCAIVPLAGINFCQTIDQIPNFQYFREVFSNSCIFAVVVDTLSMHFVPANKHAAGYYPFKNLCSMT